MHKVLSFFALGAAALMLTAGPSTVLADQQICTGSAFLGSADCTINNANGDVDWGTWAAGLGGFTAQQQQQFQEQVLINDTFVDVAVSSENVNQIQNNNQNLNQTAVNIVGGGSGDGNNAGSISQSGANVSDQTQRTNDFSFRSPERRRDVNVESAAAAAAGDGATAIANTGDDNKFKTVKVVKKVVQADVKPAPKQETKGDLPKELPATGADLGIILSLAATAAGAGVAAAKRKFAAESLIVG